tara:strand:- start:2251 stop:2550 length:300 start_codon:yes stop_codon:yes gene_type:complete
MPTIRGFVEQEDIYIDCNPVSIYGGEEITDNKNDLTTSSEVLDDLALNFSTTSITNNVGFQTLLGVTLLGILYGLGNYVFKELPKNLIDNKLNKLNKFK